MTKRHFEALAAALKGARVDLKRIQAARPLDAADAFRVLEQITIDVAHVCSDTNPRFDRARFLAACGLEG